MLRRIIFCLMILSTITTGAANGFTAIACSYDSDIKETWVDGVSLPSSVFVYPINRLGYLFHFTKDSKEIKYGSLKKILCFEHSKDILGGFCYIAKTHNLIFTNSKNERIKLHSALSPPFEG